MKKTIFALLILIMLTLTACAGQAPVAHNARVTSADQLVSYLTNKHEVASTASTIGGLTTDFENAEPIIVQLVLGIIKLDGTDLAITKDQATTMLPLWDEYVTQLQAMMPDGGKPGAPANGNSTPAARPTMDPKATPAAPVENTEATAKLDAIVTKMVAVLTDKQVNAIAEMKITRDIAQTIMKEKNITDGGPDQQNGTAPKDGSSQSGQPQQPPADGQQPPAGGPGGGQQGGQPNQQGNQPQQGQPPSGNGPRGFGMVQPGLQKAFTTLLEKVSGTKSSVASIPAGVNPAGSSSGGPDQAGGANDSSSTVTYAAVYQQKGGTAAKSDQTINAAEKDQSAVLVTDSGTLNLSKSKITTSGNTSSQDSSSFFGLNAAVLATSGSVINISESTINTTGEGANGAFATGSGSTVNLTNVVIDATAGGGHGVMATRGGSITLKDVDITTAGKNSGALATDRGGGTITAEGGTVTTTGVDSPAIYSTGNISVSNGVYSATGAESAVIEGGNSITMENSTLTSSLEEKWGVMIYQSMSGDAEGTKGTFTMTGGELSLTARKGPLFYVTNSTGVINLTGVSVTTNSGELINASAGRWGNNGSNGGTVILTADEQNLNGSIIADSISSVEVILKNGSSLKSAINPTNSAKDIKLTLDATSTWNVTANSYISTLSDPDGINGNAIVNIKGNGFTVYYNSSASPELGGKTYTLDGGGTLTPAP